MKRPYKDESLRWLTQAKDEFGDAEELRKMGRFYLALFHFQQATEKGFQGIPLFESQIRGSVPYPFRRRAVKDGS